jgi:competence protein ComEC
MRPSETLFNVAVLFLTGIAVAALNMNGWIVFALTAGLSGGFLLSAIKKQNKKLKLWSALAWIIFMGCFYFYFRESLSAVNLPLNRETTFTAKVVKYPEVRDKSQVLNLRLEFPWSGDIVSYNRVYPEYDYGDLLKMTGLIQQNRSGYSISFPKIVLISKNQGSFLYANLFDIKVALMSSLRRNLPVSKAGFAIAMLFGDKSLLQESFIENMRKTGTSHLVALSGYNILIIVSAVQVFLGAVGLKRRSFLITNIFISAFILMTGMSASAVRAGIMALLMTVAKNNNRIYAAKNPIVFTALTMILINPRFLVFDLGFQLSFLALIGIVYVAPLLKQKLKIENKGFLGWKENAVQTFSAQIMVAPLLFFKMGEFNLLSIVPNILILGVVPAIMFGGFVTAVLGLVYKPLSIVVGWGLGLFLTYAQGIITRFAYFM